MSVNEPTAHITARQEDWKKCRAFIEGRSMVTAPDGYIRKLPGHDDETFKAFREVANFLNATARTVEAFSGMVFRKKPQAEWPNGFEEVADDVTRAGHSARQFSKELVEEVISVGWVGVLVDHPPAQEGASQADAERAGHRPYARLYAAETILEVRERVQGSDRVIDRVRLAETRTVPDPKDEFKETKIERVRVLDMDEGRYRQRIFEKPNKEWELIEEVYPLIAGATLKAIPFRAFSANGHVASPPKPPLLDLVEVSCSHVNSSCLLEWGQMWTANPTPCFVNLDLKEGETVALGSSSGLRFNKEGTAFFLEFTGAGLDSIRTAMEDKRRDMATLGARMLMEERKQVEAAETAQIHRAGESSVLASIAGSVGEGVEWVLQWLAQWGGRGEVEVSYKLNTDYMPMPLSPQELMALMAAWQGGAISREDLFARLQRGEVIAEGKTVEDQREELENEPVSVPGGLGDDAG